MNRRLAPSFFSICVGLTLLAVGAAPLRADEQLPLDVLKTLKAASVFIKVRSGELQGSGSGFLMQLNGKDGLIVTNHHVVTPPRPGSPVVVDVVFHSGQKEEQVVRAEIVATDAERDLAILRVRDLKEPPTPLDLAQKVDLIETMQVYIFGFPFGEALSTTKGNPAITVTKGNVSSIRKDDRNRVKVVQLDGDVNPGNSGGPVVDAKGHLVGVVVAKIRGTKIGMAIPPAELSEMLDGRLASLNLRPGKIADGTAEIQVELRLIDPLNRIEKVAVLVVPTEKMTDVFKADKDGKWPPLPNAELVELKLDGQKAVGILTLKSGGKNSVSYTIQPAYTNGQKVLVHAQPGKPYVIDFVRASAGGGSPGSEGSDLTKVAKPQDVGDLKVKEATFGSGQAPACLCWTEDAHGFYHLDGKGTVRRLSLPDLKEEATLETGKKCAWLSLSAVGVVLTVTDAQEVWLLDSQTLKVNDKISVPGIKRAVSAPKSSYAYATQIEIASARLYAIDLKAARIAKFYGQDDFSRRGVNFDHAVLTADGRYLFGTGGIEQVFRFRMDGAEVQFEEVSPRLLQGRFENLCVSPGNDFMCAPVGGGNYGLNDQPRVPYSTYIYPINSFKSPAVVVKSGAYPLAVGFDLRSGLIYAQNFDHQLIVFDAQGTKLKEYKLDGNRGSSSRQFLVHPDGRKLVVLGDAGQRGGSPLWVVELPPK